jgi:hypothetical protein
MTTHPPYSQVVTQALMGDPAHYPGVFWRRHPIENQSTVHDRPICGIIFTRSLPMNARR